MNDSRRKGILSLDWELIAAVLAEENSDEQTKFFKSFVKECKTWGTNLQIEMQLAHVNKGLSSDEKKTLSMISFTE